MSRSSHRPAGFTLIELMVVVAIVGIMALLAASSLTGLQRQARASGQARLIVNRLQTLRTSAVAQGWPQGYYFGGPGDANPVLSNLAWCASAGCDFIFRATSPTANATYVAGQEQYPLDPLPFVSGTLVQLLTVRAKGVGPASFTVGFDLNGLPRIDPPPIPMVWPICISVQDVNDAVTLRWVIVFSDGTARIQKDNETFCT
jgi:prepilin-type N-terminal cleavage/methylation domain-containing protein